MVDQIHKFGIRPFRSLIVVIRLVGSSRESSFVMNPRKMSTTVQRKKPWLIAVGDGKAKATSIVPPRLSAGGCPQKKRCTAGPYRRLFVHEQESVRLAVRALVGTPAYERSRRDRYRIEGLFADSNSACDSGV